MQTMNKKNRGPEIRSDGAVGAAVSGVFHPGHGNFTGRRPLLPRAVPAGSDVAGSQVPQVSILEALLFVIVFG